MQSRPHFSRLSPGARKAMLDTEAYLAKCSIERRLLHLIKMRASQINGCAYLAQLDACGDRADGAIGLWESTAYNDPDYCLDK